MSEIDLTQLPYIIKDIPEYKQLKESEGIRFIGACLQHINKTNSQNFQDVWAAYESGYTSRGFFVEFGATNGIDGSNTLMLEREYGWDGILAEPISSHHESLEQNRKAKICKKCVFDKSGDMIEFVITDEPDLSTIKGFGLDDEHGAKRKSGKEVYVETVTLLDMLIENEAPHFIDYLSIDTEGSEYDILRTFFAVKDNPFDIWTITVEHNNNPEYRQKLYDLLTAQGYTRKFTEFSRWDDFYTKVLK